MVLDTLPRRAVPGGEQIEQSCGVARRAEERAQRIDPVLDPEWVALGYGEAKLATCHKAATGKWRHRRDRLGARARPGRLDCPLDKPGRHDTRHPDRDGEPGAVGP